MSPAVKVVPPPARHPTASLPSPSKPFYTRTRRFSLPLQSLTNPNPNSTSSSVATACINPPLAFATTDISSLAPILHESDPPNKEKSEGEGSRPNFHLLSSATDKFISWVRREEMLHQQQCLVRSCNVARPMDTG
jgi:hypothetical protein